MPARSTPPAVFWRRRLLVLAALVAVVWVGLRIVDTGDDGEPEAEVPATPAPQATAVPDGELLVRVAAGGDACAPELVRVTPSVKSGQENRGPIDIGLVVSTTAEEPCTLQPADADLVAIISQDGDPVWDSTRCATSLLTEPVALSPRWATSITQQWSGRRSGSACSSKEDWAPGGEYRIQAGTLGGEPGETTFEVKAVPEPEPKKDDEDSDEEE